MKYILLSIFIFNIHQIIYSQEYLQEFFTIFYSNTYNNKVLTQEEYLNKLSNIQEILLSSNQLSQEEKLIVKGYTEDIFAKISKRNNSKLSVKEIAKIKENYTNIENYINTGNSSNITTILMKANIGSVVLAYYPLAELIKIAKQNKKDYEFVLKQDNKIFDAYLGLALWYYFSPKIGGGDVNISLDYLNQGEQYALSSLQKFHLYSWRSQVFFRQGLLKESQQQLDKASAIFPYSHLINSMKQSNQKGKYFK